MIQSKITDDKEHAQALQRIEELMDVPDDDPRMYELLYLSDIVADYEESHYPTPELSPLEVIGHLMHEHEMKQKDLVPLFGSKAMVSMILSGKRKLTVDKVQKLSAFFGVPSHLFIEGGTSSNIPRRVHGPDRDSAEDIPSADLVQMVRSVVQEELERYLGDNADR